MTILSKNLSKNLVMNLQAHSHLQHLMFLLHAHLLHLRLEAAEDEGELYTLAKNLWIVVGQKSMRPQAKYVARVLAEYYSNLHQTVFGEARALPEDAELEDGAGEGAADGEADGAEAGDAGEADEAKGAA